MNSQHQLQLRDQALTLLQIEREQMLEQFNLDDEDRRSMNASQGNSSKTTSRPPSSIGGQDVIQLAAS